jgi:hypothetical protein
LEKINGVNPVVLRTRVSSVWLWKLMNTPTVTHFLSPDCGICFNIGGRYYRACLHQCSWIISLSNIKGQSPRL